MLRQVIRGLPPFGFPFNGTRSWTIFSFLVSSSFRGWRRIRQTTTLLVLYACSVWHQIFSVLGCRPILGFPLSGMHSLIHLFWRDEHQNDRSINTSDWSVYWLSGFLHLKRYYLKIFSTVVKQLGSVLFTVTAPISLRCGPLMLYTLVFTKWIVLSGLNHLDQMCPWHFDEPVAYLI